MSEARVADELRGSYAENLLLYIYDQGGYVARDQLEEFTGDPFAASETVQELEDRGLAEVMSIASDVKLTSRGSRIADHVQKSIVSGPRRVDRVIRAILNWLGVEQAPQSVREFLRTRAASELRMTEMEVDDAADFLFEQKYVDGTHVAESNELLIPRILPKGRAALRSDELLGNYEVTGPATVSNDYSSRVTFGDQAQVGGFQSGGAGNVQNVTQTIAPEVRRALAEHVAKLIQQAAELPDETPGVVEVREDLDEIGKEIVKPDAKPGVLKGLANKTLAAFAVAAATSGGQHVVQGLAHLVKMLEHLPS
jgi:hypothetical protein